MTTIQTMLEQFGANNGIPGLILDEFGACTLTIDEECVIHLQYDAKQKALLFLASLGEVPIEVRGDVYGALLYANLFWAESQGATLALEPETEEIVLQFFEAEATLDSFRLEQLLNNFADTSIFWKKRLAAFCGEAMKNQDGVEEQPQQAPSITGWDKA